MKNLKKILAIGGIIAGIALVRLGYNRWDKCPDEDYQNAAINAVGLLSATAGIAYFGREGRERYFG